MTLLFFNSGKVVYQELVREGGYSKLKIYFKRTIRIDSPVDSSLITDINVRLTED